MRTSASTEAPERVDCDLLAVLVASDRSLEPLADLDRRVGGVLARAVGLGDFEARSGEWLLGYSPAGSGATAGELAASPRRERVHSGGGDRRESGSQEADGAGPLRVLFLGVGRSSDMDGETMRTAAGRAYRIAEDMGAPSLALCLTQLVPDRDPSDPDTADMDVADMDAADMDAADMDAVDMDAHDRDAPHMEAQWIQAAAEGLVLASWRYEDLREAGTCGSRMKPPSSAVVVSHPSTYLDSSVHIGYMWGHAENRARTLQAMPGNVATPTRMAEEAARKALTFSAASGVTQSSQISPCCMRK